MSTESIHSYFSGRAASYRRSAERGLWAFQRRREANAIEMLAGPCAGHSLLDLGCGAGFYARRFAAKGCTPIIAVDSSSAMVSQIREPEIVALVGDVATVSLDGEFDIVIAAGVLEFVPDPLEVLKNVRRHLAARGRAVLLVPPANLPGRLYRSFHGRHGITIRLYNPEELARMTASAGLRVIDRRHVFPYSDAYALQAI